MCGTFAAYVPQDVRATTKTRTSARKRNKYMSESENMAMKVI